MYNMNVMAICLSFVKCKRFNQSFLFRLMDHCLFYYKENMDNPDFKKMDIKLPKPMSLFGAVFFEETLMLFGGIDSDGPSKDIWVKELNNYDEILLIGSGKGVASVKKIKDINWKRKSLKKFNVFLKYYHSAIKKCKNYNFG